jgi:aldehyde dehydrogenase (NAD+)
MLPGTTSQSHEEDGSMTQVHGNYIGGKWVASNSGKTFLDVNPADTSEVLGEFQLSTREDARRAIEAAQKAQPAWGRMPAPQRGKILLKAARLIEERAPALGEILTREEGKTFPEGKGEVLRGAAILEFFSGEGCRFTGETIPSESERVFLYTIRKALGVVSLITPWNFPIAIPCWKLGAALIAGNAVVLKPASLTPLIAVKLVEVLAEAGLPPGVLNLVVGPGSTVGHEVVTHPAVKAISFTGSCDVGIRIHHDAAKNLTRTQLEMGGKNPTIVLEDADLDEAAEIVFLGTFLSTGHKCTATSRAIVLEPVLDAFTQRIVERTRKAKVGNGMDPATVIGPVVDETQMNTILGFIQRAKRDGAKLLLGGSRLTGGIYDKGYFVEPTIFGRVEPNQEIAQEEVFGPVLAVIPARSFEHAIEIANGVKFGLSASLCTKNLSRAMEYVDRIEAGVIKVNQVSSGIECHAPFGGTKASSTGFREQGSVAVDFFSEPRTVYMKY